MFIWCADLVEIQQFSKWNRGYRYLLMVLDVLSKYGKIVPLKDKKGDTVAETFKTILKEGSEPQYLWVDKDKESYNKHLKDLLEKHNIPRMKKSHLFVKDGIEQSKPKCGSSSLFKVIHSI